MASAQELVRKVGYASRLEQVFGFENAAFRTYVRMHAVSDKSPVMMLELSDMMAHHTHPIVQTAAGWAAYEAGVPRSNVRRVTFPRRLDALDKAKGLWEKSIFSFEEAITAEESPKVAADLLGYELRSRQAIAYMPSMQLAAYWFSGLECREDAIRNAHRQSKKGVLALASHVVTLPGQDNQFRNVRTGMSAEILVGALLNDDPHSRYIIIPGSIRQDNNVNPFNRADLLAIDTYLPHKRIRIQITANDALKDEEKGRVIIKTDDLLLDPKDDSHTLLRKYIEKERGIPQSPSDLAWLDLLPITLADKLDDYVKQQGWK